MNDAGWLGQIAKVTGIGGIAVGAALLVFRDIIRKKIFPQLDKRRAFHLLFIIVVAAWSLGIAGIVGYVYIQREATFSAVEFSKLYPAIERVTLRDKVELQGGKGVGYRSPYRIYFGTANEGSGSEKQYHAQMRATNEVIAAIRQNVFWISALPEEAAEIILIGHVDESSTAEYSLALGERLASFVKKLFLKEGVPSVDTISAYSGGSFTASTLFINLKYDHSVNFNTFVEVYARVAPAKGARVGKGKS